jgi:tRNA U34 5-methylaminomethyl-2-thiouridine-forming methyltransferase MnmC
LHPELTADGSFTFFSLEFGETFHSLQGAREEAERKFIQPTLLEQKAQKSTLHLLDVCYGLGYNSAAALTKIWEVNPQCRVNLIGLELNSEVPQAAIAHQLLNLWPQPVNQVLTELAFNFKVDREVLQAQLLIGDARQTIQQVRLSGFLADAIFLDPFSPPKCPQLWTVEFLGMVAECLQPQGRLATYSCAAAVRTALMAAGLKIGATTPVGRRSPGTVASYTDDQLPTLSPPEYEHLQTKAAIPYRDCDLCDSAAKIWQRRQQEQQTSSLESTSQWKKRWGFK